MAKRITKIIDGKLKRLDFSKTRAAKLLKQPRNKLFIGVMKPEAMKTHPGTDGATVGQVALWMEYGTQNSPARSWLRDWIEINRKDIGKQLGADTLRVVFGAEDERSALEKRGLQYSRAIKGRINQRIPPPNKPSTLKRKKGDVPLIDSGAFKRAITFRVE